MLVGADRPHEQPDLQKPIGLARGGAHFLRGGHPQCYGCLTEDMLAAVQGRDDELRVNRARQANVDGIDIGAFDQQARIVEWPGLADICDRARTVQATRRDTDHLDVVHAGVGACMHGAHRACSQDADPDHDAKRSATCLIWAVLR